ncbi:MAG: AI-2E family transporter [Candidatus Uhrbacteria bacterium]
MAEIMKTEITVRAATILKIVAVFVGIALLWYLRDIAALVFVSIILAVLISPAGDLCERYRLPRALGVTVVYFVVLAVLGVLSTLLAQPFIVEVRNLAGSFPAAWDRVLSAVDFFRSFSAEHGFAIQLQQYAKDIEQTFTAGVFGFLSGIFGGAISFGLVLVLTFYFSTYATVARRTLISLAPSKWQPFLIGVVPRIERKMGSWLRGLLILGTTMGVLSFIGLSVIGVEYAILLAALTAIAELVPYVGAIVSVSIAVLLTLLQGSFTKAIAVLIFYVVIQQVENHILVPRVMHRAVGVHPVVIIIAMLIGAKIGGLPGILLTIPVAAGVIVFFEEYGRERRHNHNNQ